MPQGPGAASYGVCDPQQKYYISPGGILPYLLVYTLSRADAGETVLELSNLADADTEMS